MSGFVFLGCAGLALLLGYLGKPRVLKRDRF
ncbi:hypothetical protein WG78_07330 [Amantichitinum ursilacus]|uniref:Uncharacterized protein n=1 Tax=Amantichitinum ursilacus TaxID=857265 RepID=A0A0N0XK61_9NEIS|nr:hypothetical protein WG78_07330 [Amantichitinum ursilacus]